MPEPPGPPDVGPGAVVLRGGPDGPLTGRAPTQPPAAPAAPAGESALAGTLRRLGGALGPTMRGQLVRGQNAPAEGAPFIAEPIRNYFSGRRGEARFFLGLGTLGLFNVAEQIFGPLREPKPGGQPRPLFGPLRGG